MVSSDSPAPDLAPSVTAPDPPPAPVGHTVKVVAPPEWRPWLIAQLIARGYARQGDTRPDKIRFYLLALERDIAARLPGGSVPLATLRNVVYHGVLPSHPTARGLAAALCVSEIAILLRSGQLDYDAVTPLLGDMPAILRSEREYHAMRSHAEHDPDPMYRVRFVALLDHDWQASQRLEARLRWLGITSDEWERMRLDLNRPDGRQRLVRALYGGTDDDDGTAPLDAPDVPAEFTDAAGDAERDSEP